jgi:nucleoside-diphosphate-sugar epimerase
MRIAILGANGQVGTEVALLLRDAPGIEVVPICRNRLGSTYLRSRGVACRHGSVGDPAQAPRLIGDCDLVASFALALGRPGEARRANDAVARSVATASAPGARIVYFSTMSIYGDARPGRRVRLASWYGREKLHGERFWRRLARRQQRASWILRLGHVCGDLQNITAEIRARLVAGSVVLPSGGRLASNTVYTATIADAIMAIATDRERPGTYDLMSRPSWSWREVYAYEAVRIGHVLEIVEPPRESTGPARAARGWVTAAARRIVGASIVRDGARSLLSRLPNDWSERAQSSLHLRRAAAEIDALRPRRSGPEGSDWIALGSRWLTTISTTEESLRRHPDRLDAPTPAGAPFAGDLPMAGLPR